MTSKRLIGLEGYVLWRPLVAIAAIVLASGCADVNPNGKAVPWGTAVAQLLRANYSACPTPVGVAEQSELKDGWNYWAGFQVVSQADAENVVNNCLRPRVQFTASSWVPARTNGVGLGGGWHGSTEQFEHSPVVAKWSDQIELDENLGTPRNQLGRTILISRRDGIPFRVDVWLVSS